MNKEQEEFFANISQFTNNKLCEIIATNRYLKIMHDEAKASMEELAKRRAAGDNFEYEKHIDQIIASLPKFNLDLSKITKIPKVF